jgi:hypothetical protein
MNNEELYTDFADKFFNKGKELSVKPNIFNYATSELSQDAFFCWLFAWSHKDFSNEKLNKISMDFINGILKKADKQEIILVDKIEIVRQEAKIDFYIRINDKIIILFEDKIKTEKHDNQLERYKDYINQKYKNHEIVCVYLKTSLIWREEKKSVCGDGYFPLDIFDIRDIFKCAVSENGIFNDFVSYILAKSSAYTAYLTLPLKDFIFEDESKSDAWQGFYNFIETEIPGSGIAHWAGGLKTWFGLSNIYKDYDEEIDGEAQVSLILDKYRITVDTVVIHSDTNIAKYQDYLYDILERSDIGKLYNLQFAGQTSNSKNVRIAIIDNVFVLKEDGVIDSIKTVEVIRNITNIFNCCFKDEIS